MSDVTVMTGDDQLMAVARKAMTRSHSPYSGYRVGSALLTSDGTMVSGCNVENVSYGLTMCAERVALGRAIAQGHRSFRAIAIATDGSADLTPCGACRQVLAEFAPDLKVVTEGSGERRVWTLSALLPEPFTAPPDWHVRKDEKGT